ncbi:MAG: hypothetical protein JNM70_15530 [Anaerolineae bacterium]|nr:hypothetical protein [Anaerolineae bacterium]
MAAQDYDELQQDEQAPPPPRRPASTLALWLLGLTMLFLFGVNFLIYSTIREGRAPLEEQLADIKATLEATAAPDAAVEAARSQVMEVLNVNSQLASIYDSLAASYTNWPALIRVLSDFDISQMHIDRLVQQDKLITIMGEGIDELQVMTYANVLRDSGFFTRVTIQTLNIVAPTPLPAGVTPTAPQTRSAQFSIVAELGKSG